MLYIKRFQISRSKKKNHANLHTTSKLHIRANYHKHHKINPKVCFSLRIRIIGICNPIGFEIPCVQRLYE